MVIRIVARQAAVDLVERKLRQDRDTVEALLAVGLDIVAQRLDLGARELLVDRLDLLQADDVGRALGQPVGEVADAGADAVDVPGDDFHDGLFFLRRVAFDEANRIACRVL